MNYRSTLTVLAFSGALLSTAVSGAWAWEADAVAERLKGALAEQGVEFGWTSIERSGSSIALSGVEFGSREAGGKAAVGRLTLEGVSEDEDSYIVGHVGLPAYSSSNDKGTLTISGLSVEGLDIPKSGEAPAMLRYERAALASMAVLDRRQKEIFTLTGLSAEMRPSAGGRGFSFTNTADAFTLDLAAVTKEEEKRRTLEDIGYSQISGTAAAAGSWNPSDGHLALSRYDVAVDGAGTFRFTFDIGGVTPAFLKAMRRMGQDAFVEGGDMAQLMAVAGMVQQLTLGGLVMRFEDDGLTEKVLRARADEQGVTPRDVANDIEASVRSKIAPHLGSDLSGTTADAIGAFLDDPQAIEIRAAPASPLPFAAISMGFAMGAPDLIVNQLGLTIAANR